MEDPFSPGSSAAPPQLVGRIPLRTEFGEALQRLGAGQPARDIGLIGERGMGKSVLLHYFEAEARRSGHATVMLRGYQSYESGLVAQLTAKLPALARQVRPGSRHARQAIKESITEVRAAVDLGVMSAEVAATPNARISQAAVAENTLRVLAAEARHSRQGLVILVDEGHDARPDDLRLLTGVIDTVSAAESNVMMVMGGLPKVRDPQHVGSANFLERFRWHRLQPLSRVEATLALDEPFIAAGVSLTQEAGDAAWELSRGHPHVVQLVGSHLVKSLEHPGLEDDVITKAHVDMARPGVIADLSSGVFPSRWGNLDSEGRRLARSLASLENELLAEEISVERVVLRSAVPVGEAMARLSTQDAFALSADGVTVRLAVPALGEWIRSQRPEYDASLSVGSNPSGPSVPEGGDPLEETFRRLTRLIEQRAYRAELGLPPDHALNAAMALVIQDAAAAARLVPDAGAAQATPAEQADASRWAHLRRADSASPKGASGISL